MSKKAAEAAAFIHGDKSTATAAFGEAVTATALGLSVTLSEVQKPVAEATFRAFLDSGELADVAFLADRLEAAFFFYLLSLDPEAAELTRAAFEKKTFYLDTNFLFALLGLHGVAAAIVPTTVMKLCQTLSARIAVSAATLAEYRSTIAAKTVEIRKLSLSRASSIRIAAEIEASSVEIAQAYYRLLRAGQVSSPDDFAKKQSSVEGPLHDWGVDIDKDLAGFRGDLPERAKNWVSRLNTVTDNKRDPKALEHDVFLLSAITDARGAETGHLAAPIWLLTLDRKLAKFAAYVADTGAAPAAVFAEDWLRAVRPFIARTDDYDRALAATLRHAVLFERQDSVPFEHIVSSLRRLERYKELPPDVVARMVANGAFRRRLEDASAGSEQEHSLIELEARQALAEIKTEQARVAGDLERKEAALTAVRAELAAERQAGQKAREEGEGRLKRIESERDSLKEKVRDLADTVSQVSDSLGALRDSQVEESRKKALADARTSFLLAVATQGGGITTITGAICAIALFGYRDTMDVSWWKMTLLLTAFAFGVVTRRELGRCPASTDAGTWTSHARWMKWLYWLNVVIGGGIAINLGSTLINYWLAK